MLKDAKIRDEAELESILIGEPDQIENKFLVLKNQRSASGLKRMDILGIDQEDVLTIVELKVTVDPNQLRQAVQYYDWLMQQGTDWVSDAYRDKLAGRKIAERMPQIYLIAPEFDGETLVEAKYFRSDIKIRFFKYLAFEVEGKKHIKTIEEPLSPIKEIETKPWTVDDNKNYISDNAARRLFTNFIERVKQLDSKVREVPSAWAISYWISGRKFCEIYPRKEWFNTGFKTDDDVRWSNDMRIATTEKADEAFERIKAAFNLMKRGRAAG
jgi:hypothetical protein